MNNTFVFIFIIRYYKWKFIFSCIELRVAFELKLMLEAYTESWVERLLRPVTEENAFKHKVSSPYDRRFNLRLTVITYFCLWHFWLMLM